MLSYLDVLCVSETFLNATIPDSHLTLDGFNIERCYRSLNGSKGNGGGAAIYILI